MRNFFILLALPLLVVSVSAQTLHQHRVLVRYQGLQPEKYLPPLDAFLTSDKLALWVVPSKLAVQATEDDVIKEARSFACDLVLSIENADSSGKDEVSWRLWSPEEAKPRVSGKVMKERPDWATVADVYWLFLSKPLESQLGPGSPPWPKATVSDTVEFKITARPGTLVKGLASGPVLVPETGVAVVSLAIPVSLVLEGRLAGWRTRAERVFVNSPAQAVALHQTPLADWALTASLNNFAFPSFGVEWYPNRGNLALRAQIDQFLGGLYFGNQSNATASSWPVQSLPLATVQLGAAWFWSPAEEQLRFYTAADLGVRWIFPQFRIFTVEPIVPLTLEPLAGWDYRWTEGQSLYFELGPTIQWAPNADNFRASQKSSMVFEVPLPGVPLFVEFPLKAKVGYRWSF